jgi:hypothetical protein
VGIQKHFIRMTPEDLRRALDDPAWAGERLEALAEAWIYDDSGPEETAELSVDKSWHGIEFALASAGFEAYELDGEETLPTGEEWDYGDPTYLTADEVYALAERFATVSMRSLVDSVDPERVRTEKPYQVGEWTQDDRDYVTFHGERLQRFISAAARAGDAVVITLG